MDILHTLEVVSQPVWPPLSQAMQVQLPSETAADLEKSGYLANLYIRGPCAAGARRVFGNPKLRFVFPQTAVLVLLYVSLSFTTKR